MLLRQIIRQEDQGYPGSTRVDLVSRRKCTHSYLIRNLSIMYKKKIERHFPFRETNHQTRDPKICPMHAQHLKILARSKASQPMKSIALDFPSVRVSYWNLSHNTRLSLLAATSPLQFAALWATPPLTRSALLNTVCLRGLKLFEV